MINNIFLTNAVGVQLKYKPNSKESSYYKIYMDSNSSCQIRVSNHGTFLKTWIDRDYDPCHSINISIAFTQNGVPANNCIINDSTDKPFQDCSSCITYQQERNIVCKPREVAGISNRKRKFNVVQYVYNCDNLNETDVQLLVGAIRRATIHGEYQDPFINTEKAANKVILIPEERRDESKILGGNRLIEACDISKLLHRNRYHPLTRQQKGIIRISEPQLNQLIEEIVKKHLYKYL